MSTTKTKKRIVNEMIESEGDDGSGAIVHESRAPRGMMRSGMEVETETHEEFALSIGREQRLLVERMFGDTVGANREMMNMLIALNKQLGQQVADSQKKIIEMAEVIRTLTEQTTHTATKEEIANQRWESAISVVKQIAGGVIAERAALPRLQRIMKSLSEEQMGKIFEAMNESQIAEFEALAQRVDAALDSHQD